MVTGALESLACNCPDFEVHKTDPGWRCKHILAVLKQQENHSELEPTTETSTPTPQKKSDPEPTEPAEKKKSKGARNGKTHSQLLIKRSVSPDGRIDSLSVEFSDPIDWNAKDEIMTKAKKILLVQAEIVNKFLEAKGPGRSQISEKTNEASTKTAKAKPSPMAEAPHARALFMHNS